MDRVRHAVIATAALGAALVLVVAPRVAAAQHCHIPDVEPGASSEGGPAWWLQGTTSAIAGATTFMDESLHYEGLRVAVDAGTGRYTARVALPAYRVEGAGVGLGDATFAMSADVVPGRGRVRGGLGVSIAAPTGDADDGRGMGHVMVAGGPWLRFGGERFDLTAAVTFASTLGDNSEHVLHQHAADGWPLVDPMNPREVMGVARGVAALVPGQLNAGGQLTFATPVGLDGERRLVGAVLVERPFGRYGLHLLVEAPFIGDPFVARALFELSYRFPT
jgi:hypothetical protein